MSCIRQRHLHDTSKVVITSTRCSNGIHINLQVHSHSPALSPGGDSHVQNERIKTGDTISKNQTNGAALMDLREFMDWSNATHIGITETGENAIKQIFFNWLPFAYFSLSFHFYFVFSIYDAKNTAMRKNNIFDYGVVPFRIVFVSLWHVRHVHVEKSD